MKVLLKAYMNRNLGDDLFLCAAVKRYPDAEFMLAAETNGLYDDFINEHKNVHDFCGHTFIYRVLRKFGKIMPAEKSIIKSFDAVLYIGGSIFMENENERYLEDSFTAETSICERYGIPYYILSCNFGPYRTEAYRQKAEKWFSKCEDVCFRDTASYNMFSDIPSTRFAPDAVFSLGIKRDNVRHDVLGVAVIDYSDREDKYGSNGYDEFLKRKIIEHLDEKNENTVELFCFCEREGDVRAAKRISDSMQKYNERISIVVYNGGAVEYAKRFVSCGKVISSRFHGVLLAIACGVPVIPHIYSKKTENLLNDMCVISGILQEDYKIYIPNSLFVKDTQKIWSKFDKLYKNFTAKIIDKIRK